MQKKSKSTLSNTVTVGYKGISPYGAAHYYAPYIPQFMTNLHNWASCITLNKGYKGEWVIHVPYAILHPVIDWCHQSFGEPGRKRTYKWRRSYVDNQAIDHRIFLRHEKDVLLFRLKWM